MGDLIAGWDARYLWWRRQWRSQWRRVRSLTVSLLCPDYTNTEPPVDILHNPSWDDKTKIVSLDPYGHLAPQLFKSFFDAGSSFLPFRISSLISILIYTRSLHIIISLPRC